ncbi:MAG: NAD(+) synthase [Oscillospiraceae bacterium]|nr:NAD(+) synthase [Oscillospiraceae bacterium]
MRNYKEETEKRVAFIRQVLAESGCRGIVFGNSGGKDSALVGILCKMACDNTLGVLMPCATTQNYGSDTDDALLLAAQFQIESRTVDLTEARNAEIAALEAAGVAMNSSAVSNIAPRLRMTTLYAIAAAEGRLVAGTGNKCEIYMGYFTKWGDGAADFNPIADLTVSEIFAFLDYLDGPESIRKKAPSAGLFEGQTDEKEMGVTYAAIERYMDGGEVTPEEKAIIDRFHRISEHKRTGRKDYPG